MSALGNLSANQFRVDQATSMQGNPDDLVMHRGIQKMTTQNPLPFTFDYMGQQSNPSTARSYNEMQA